MRTGWSAPLVRRLARGLAALGLILGAATPVAAQTLTFSGSPAVIKVVTATAGSAPTAVTNTATTYTTGTTAGNPKKITAQLSSNMPTGVTLRITLAAVTGSTAVGIVTLNNTVKTVLNNITTTTNRTGAITYTLSSTVAAGVVSSSRIVTFTLVTYP